MEKGEEKEDEEGRGEGGDGGDEEGREREHLSNYLISQHYSDKKPKILR